MNPIIVVYAGVDDGLIGKISVSPVYRFEKKVSFTEYADIAIINLPVTGQKEYEKIESFSKSVILLSDDPMDAVDAVGKEKVRKFILTLNQENIISDLQNAIRIAAGKRIQTFRLRKTYVDYNTDDIYAVYLANRKLYIALKDKNVQVSYVPLEQIEAQLGDDFTYSDRSCLINLRHISSIQKNKITLENGMEEYVGRYRIKEFRKRIAEFQ